MEEKTDYSLLVYPATCVGKYLVSFPRRSLGTRVKVADSWSAGFACKRKQSPHSCCNIGNDQHRLAQERRRLRHLYLMTESRRHLCIKMSAGAWERCIELKMRSNH